MMSYVVPTDVGQRFGIKRMGLVYEHLVPTIFKKILSIFKINKV